MARSSLDLSTILERLHEVSGRPRFAFQVLSLLSEAADRRGQAGPYVVADGQEIPIREWLGHQVSKTSRKHYRRYAMRARICEALSVNEKVEETDAQVDRLVGARATVAGGANVSRAVTDLEKCGLVRRYYKGEHIDHVRKGGRRHAVYVVMPEAMAALKRGTILI